MDIRFSSIFVDKEIEEHIRKVYEYHIPVGRSPEISSETLKDLIKNAKYTVVFPLLAGTWQTANLISSGSICTCHSMCYNYRTNNINFNRNDFFFGLVGRLSFEEKGRKLNTRGRQPI